MDLTTFIADPRLMQIAGPAIMLAAIGLAFAWPRRNQCKGCGRQPKPQGRCVRCGRKN